MKLTRLLESCFKDRLFDDLRKLGAEISENGTTSTISFPNREDLDVTVRGDKVFATVKGFKADIDLGGIENTASEILALVKSLNRQWFKDNDPHGDQW